MNSLYVNTINEIQKIFARRRNIAFLIIALLLPAGGAASLSFLQDRIGISTITSAYFPVFILGIFTNFLIPIAVFAISSDLFAGEAGDKTLRLLLTRPITRFKVYISKNLSMIFFIGIMMCTVFIVSSASGLFFKEKGLLVAGLIHGIKAYTAAFIPITAVIITASFISQFFKNGSSALTTCILLYLASKGAVLISPQLSRLIPFSYTDWHMLWLGNQFAWGQILNTFMVLLSYSIIFFAAGFYFFDKKDV